jgi:hypothetical protein
MQLQARASGQVNFRSRHHEQQKQYKQQFGAPARLSSLVSACALQLQPRQGQQRQQQQQQQQLTGAGRSRVVTAAAAGPGSSGLWTPAQGEVTA